MENRDAVKRSPIDGLAQISRAESIVEQGWRIPIRFGDVNRELDVARKSVALSDRSHWGKIKVEGTHAAAALGADELTIHEGKQVPYGCLFRLRADIFFINSLPGYGEAALHNLRSAAFASPGMVTVTDNTHGHSQFLLVGPKSPELLKRICGLDIDNDQFPNLGAKQSSVAKTKQMILRTDLGSLRAYSLIGPRSLGRYLWETILQVGVDLSIASIGQAAVSKLANPNLSKA